MFLDNFVETSDYIAADNDIQNSIKQNLSDILDTRNHRINDDLPFCFGIIDTTDKSRFDLSSSQIISNKIKESIRKFESRLSGVQVSFSSDVHGQTIIEISGNYSNNNGHISRLSFKTASR